MPVYDYLCTCGSRFERFVKYEQRDESQVCGCGRTGKRVPHAPMVRGDTPGYVSPATGRWVEGRVQAQDDLRRSGCVLAEPGMQADVKRKKAQADAAFDRKLEKYVGEAVQQVLG